MSVTSEYESGWQKLEITVSPSNIITLSWPAWKLKIVSFKAEPSAFMQAASLEQYALNLEALDTLYEINDTYVWKTFKNTNEHDWSKLKKGKVVDIVDAFLEGAWTPPWKCGHCMSRMAGKYKPRF